MPMETDARLPQPTGNADIMLGISTAIVADVLSSLLIPGASTISKAIDIYCQGKFKEAQEILFQVVAEGNIDLLSNPNYENLVPNVFSYFECAQRGELKHNLKVLAHLLCDDLEIANSDASRIKRSAKRLEAMSLGDLKFLVSLKRIFDSKEASHQQTTRYYVFLDDSDVVAHEGRAYVAPEQTINSRLMDLTSRGLLFLGSNPETIGGHYFYRTDAFDEIIFAALAVRMD